MKTLARLEAIDAMRQRMLALVDDDHSMCELASQCGILCRGFSQWTFEELKKRYWWLADRRPRITREELERLANIWQVARQQVLGTQLACDTQALEHDTCRGWDEWDDPTLARFYRELCGETVDVIPDRSG